MGAQFTLVIGGAGSGKSDLGEAIALASARAPVYIATAQAFDDEMTAKIARHQEARAGAGWRTVEAPFDAGAAIGALKAGEVALLDCATLWLSNQMLAERDVTAASAALLDAIEASAAPVVVVTNEVGQGIVPETPLGREFRAAQGRLNRDLAAQAGVVVGVMAGLPIMLKGARPEGI